MKHPSYIGVTGFMTPQEVRYALSWRTGRDLPRKLMVGVLASSTTLAGRKNKYPRQFPPVEEIGRIFQYDDRALDLIHYSTDDPDTLADQLDQLYLLVRESNSSPGLIDGFQINVAWPPVEELVKFKKQHQSRKFRMVLWVGKPALVAVDHSSNSVALMVRDYVRHRVIDDVLVDASGGTGEPLNPGMILTYFHAIREKSKRVGLGFAGGLCGASFSTLAGPILSEFPDASFDAQGKLRNEDDDLNHYELEIYLREADFRTSVRS